LWNSTGTIVGPTGGLGNGSNQLNSPLGLAFDSNNSLYITDKLNYRVQKFINGSSFGITVAGWANGTNGSSPSQFYYPKSIVIDSNNNMYITDVYNNRVQQWNQSASSGVTVAGNGKHINKLVAK
jgi:sugar lactone lactonase YvrE